MTGRDDLLKHLMFAADFDMDYGFEPIHPDTSDAIDVEHTIREPEEPKQITEI